MGFDNTEFPRDIGFGSRIGPGFRTEIIELASGAEERISRWSQPRHRYDVSYGIRTYDDLLTVKKFFLARRGAAQSFRFFDWLDYATNATSVLYRDTDPAVAGSDQPLSATGVALGQGDGSAVNFQRIKEYDDAILNFERVITKPISGTALVEVNAASQTEGVDFTVNYQTGVVTFTTAPPAGQTVRWGGQFNVPVRFDQGTDEWLSATADDFSSGSLPAIGMIEEIDSTDVPDRFWMGGTIDHGNQTSTTVQINLVDGRVHRISPQDASVVAELQDADDLPAGGPIFYIQNAGSQTMNVDTTAPVTVVSLTAGNIAEILISDDGSGGKTYIALT